jgi:multidrug efflux pump subunit AcrA (membrane-fusion protein)
MSTSDTLSIEEIEQILSELEALARGASSSEIFYDQLLVRFRSLIQASQAAIVVALPQSKPFLKASTGPVSDLALLDIAARLRSQEGETAFLVESFEDRSLIAVRRQNDPQPSEFLVASLDGRLDVASHPALRELGLAFCDVMHLRSMHRLERFLAEGWPLWCKFSESIANAESVSQAAQFAVEGFRAVLMADRVSIASDGQHISAISGVTNFSSTSRLVSLMNRVVANSHQSQAVQTSPPSSESDPTAMDQGDSIGLFPHWIAIPLFSANASKSDSTLLLEWSDRHRMLDSGPVLTMLMTTIAGTWNRQRRWLSVPSFVRLRFASNDRWTIAKATGWLFKWGAFAAALAGLTVVAMLPTPVVVEATANAEPESLRPIYAPADGVIQSVHFRDADSIKKGDRVLELYSPNLEIQIEQSRGEIAETLEKRNGLNAALSQLASSQKEDESNRLRLSTEIALNQTQERLLKERLAFLMNERSRLNVQAPIDGQIISRNLDRELASRPVVHGEELLSIADLNSRWLLQARVADQDTLLLRKRMDRGDKSISFTFDNLPDRSFQGEIVEVGKAMEAEFGMGSYLPIVVAMEEEAIQHASIGAGASVVIRCESEPTWYVWTRPLVDFLRRKFWLYYPGLNR